MSLPPALTPARTLARTLACTLALAVNLHAGPGHAENIWSRTETPSGAPTYPTDETAAAVTPAAVAIEDPAPQASAPPAAAPYAVLAAAPNYNSWRGGPGAAYGAPTGGGFPLFCGSFGFGGGNRGGFTFGF